MTLLRLLDPGGLHVGVGRAVDVPDQGTDELGPVVGVQRSDPGFELGDYRRQSTSSARQE
jgi:hypothetical protein